MARRLQKTPLLGTQELSSSLKSPPSTKCSGCGEVIGGATAECAAVCCCCPCGLLNLIVLAVYKLPKGICRKAMRRKRRRRVLKSGNYVNAPRCDCDEEVVGGDLVNLDFDRSLSRGNLVNLDPEIVDMDFDERGDLVILDKEIVELEEEMWAKFYGGGFWRSPSQSQMSEKFNVSMVSTM